MVVAVKGSGTMKICKMYLSLRRRPNRLSDARLALLYKLWVLHIVLSLDREVLHRFDEDETIKAVAG